MPRNVDVRPQKVFGRVALQLPLIHMSEAEATWLEGQPQIYDKDYPLDWDGLNLNPAWWQNTGVGSSLNGIANVGGGNVRLMPWEKGYGFGGLGLTAAQQANQAKAAANKAANQAKQQAKQQAQAAKVAAKPTLPTAQPKAAYSPAAHTDATKVKTPTATQQAAAAKKACIAQGGVWDSANNICGPNPKQVACTSGGGTWANNVCTPGAAQTQCQQGGGSWAGGVCTPSAGQAACQAAGDTWSNGSCVQSNAHIQCLSTTPPGAWANGVCTPAVVASKCALTAPTTCQTGYIFGTDANGCTVCVVDPNYNPVNPAIAQCQQGGGYWNGTYCAPPPSSAMPPPDMSAGGGGGGYAPPPMPGYDPSQSAPMMSQGAQGGGFQMSQGQGPVDLSQQTGYGQPVDPSTTDDQSSGDQSDSGTTDDSANVADTNIFESVAKLFSGMGALNCGCNQPPPWFNTTLGGNAPTPQQFFTARPNQPVSPAVSSGVVLGSLVLIVGAAALFVWSKGKK